MPKIIIEGFDHERRTTRMVLDAAECLLRVTRVYSHDCNCDACGVVDSGDRVQRAFSLRLGDLE